MPPRRSTFDRSSDFLDFSGNSMSPDVQQTTSTSIQPIPYVSKTKRFWQPVQRHESTSSGSRSITSTSQISEPSGQPKPHCHRCNIPNNSANVHYNGSWILKVGRGPKFAITHSTTVSGSTVSLRFNGSGIVVFGTVPASNDTFQPPTAVYFLDQDAPFTTTLPQAATHIPNQPLFASSLNLSDVEHTLVINVTNASAPYSLKKFFVFPNSNSSSSTSSPSVRSKHTSHILSRTPALVLSILAFLVLTGMIVFLLFRRRIIAKRQLAVEVVRSTGPNARPETIYTSWTLTESILRNDSDFASSPFRSPRSQSSRSEGSSRSHRGNDRRWTVGVAPPPPPPLTPKPVLPASYSKPGKAS